jgi:NAD-dependent malate dehydrogenase
MFSSSAPKVAVLGAAGGIGQPLSLLMKLNPAVAHLSLYDVAPVTPGVAADIGHVSTPATVSGHVGESQLAAALDGADIVIIPAGVPRKPGMSRDDLFNTNASIVAGLTRVAAQVCPKAMIGIISNPVNSTVPIAAEIRAREGLDAESAKRTLFGVTTLDVMRARTFLGQAAGKDPRQIDVTVVGGHAGKTILPLLSQVQGVDFGSTEEIAALMHRIQFGGDEVVQAKAGAGSATLSMAQAGAELAAGLLDALSGKTVTQCTFVEQPEGTPGPRFFACPVTIDAEGVKNIHRDLGHLSPAEQANYDEMVKELDASIVKGVEFAKQF